MERPLFGDWSPGIGDPTLMGWLTVLAYLAGSAICHGAARRARSRAAGRGGEEARIATTWWIFAALLLALGLNKQLDLQTALSELGKTLAYRQGWYESRRRVQAVFLAVVAGGIGLALALLLYRLRRSLRRMAPALVGGALLLLFVLARATSFHHMDLFIDRRVLGLRMNWILELAGIATIAWAARRDRRRGRSSGRRGATR